LVSDVLHKKLCAVVLVFSLLTLKLSVVLTARNQIPSDLRPTNIVSIAGALREVTDGMHFRMNRIREGAKRFDAFFVPAHDGAGPVSEKYSLSELPLLQVGLIALAPVIEGALEPAFPPNTVSRK